MDKKIKGNYHIIGIGIGIGPNDEINDDHT